MSELRPLTPKQKNFCVAFVEIGSATTAYDRVYKPKRKKNIATLASRAMALPHIQHEVARLTKRLESKQAATLEEVHTFWASVLRGEDSEATVRDKIKVSELIAKTKGAFIDRVEHSGTVAHVQINLIEQDIIDIKANKTHDRPDD